MAPKWLALLIVYLDSIKIVVSTWMRYINSGYFD